MTLKQAERDELKNKAIREWCALPISEREKNQSRAIFALSFIRDNEIVFDDADPYQTVISWLNSRTASYFI